MRRNYLLAVLGILATVFFLYLALRNLDWSHLAEVLATINYAWVLPALGCQLLGYWLRALRWHEILKPTRTVPASRLFGPMMIGFAVNNLLPARVGEIARAVAVGQQESLSKSTALATVVVERVLDGLSLVFFLFLFSLFWPMPGWGIQVEEIAVAIFWVALVGMVLVIWPGSPLVVWIEKLLSFLPGRFNTRLATLLNAFIGGLHSLGQTRTLLWLTPLSLGIWALESCAYYCLSLGFNLPFSPIERLGLAILVMVMANMGGLIPSSPGYVGTFHFFVITALSAFQVQREVAVSFALIAHGGQYLMVTFIGVFVMLQSGLSLWRLSREDLTPSAP
ncbi:MAG: flippase-like domain-containing protein [Chloroflexi bacterium]|nr:flippase-like domain-containing protein [Chloroflexota bacterium]